MRNFMSQMTEYNAAFQPKEVVQQFLRRLEARDLISAEALLAPDVEMVFPGGARFTRLDELIEWARPRYRRVAKRIQRMDTGRSADGPVVICQGVLSGEWPDGETFDDIRFADWFLIENGLIKRQHVWNDLAEVMARRCQIP